MQWVSDFRHGWRALVRTPAFLVTSVITLALAIGAVVGMFSVVNTVLLRPLPFPDSDRLVVISGTAPGSDLPERFGLGQEFYLHYKERSQLIDGIFLFGAGTSTLRTENRVERISMAFPTNDIYATLGVRPQLGRLPVPDDGDRVALISDRLWSTWFGRDAAVVGKTYYISGAMREVIGVMPPEFAFPTEETLLWVAGEVRPADVRPGQLGAPVIARMKPGVTREQLAVELTRALEGTPGALRRAAQLRADHRTAQRGRGSSAGPPRRSDDEHLAVGAAGGGDGRAAHRVRQRCEPLPGPRHRAQPQSGSPPRDRCVARAARQAADDRGVHRRVAGGCAGHGHQRRDAPALPARRPRGHPPTRPRAGSICPPWLPPSGWSWSRHWPAERSRRCRPRRPISIACAMDRAAAPVAAISGRDVLVVGQTALALVLLIGSALLVQSFQRLRTVDPGYDTADIYTFQFAPEQQHLTDGPAWGRFHLDFMDRLRALPGVTDVGVVNNIPLDEGTGTGRFLTDSMAAESGGALLDQNFSGGDYFRAMGIAVLRGRQFTADEAVTPNSSVVVSQSAAARLWPDRDPLGQRIRRTGDTPQWFTVVGVVEDVKQDDWREAGEAIVYFPLTGPTRGRVGDGIAGLRRQVAAGRQSWPRGARARAAGGAGSAGVPRVHHGAPGAAVDGPAVVHHADARRHRRTGDDSGSGRLVRRAGVRRRRADAGDRRAHGARRNRQRGAAPGGVARDESGAGRRRRSASWRRWRRRAFWMRCSTKWTRWIRWCSWRCRS